MRRRPWTFALAPAAVTVALTLTAAPAAADPAPAPPRAALPPSALAPLAADAEPSRGFDPLLPSADPVDLREAHRPLSVTYTHDGEERTLDDYLARTGTQGFVVLDGRDIVFERYTAAGEGSLFQSWSVAKSFTSAAVGIALGDGDIDSIDDPVTKYLPELRGSGFDGVSLRDLLRMSSGIDWDETTDVPFVHVAASLGYPLPELAKRQERGWEPGTRFEYTSMNSFVLAWTVAEATGVPFHTYVQEKIWGPAGMGAKAFLGNDSSGNSMGYCCFYATDRDFARFGLLYLNGGRANGRQVVPASWVDRSTRPSASFNDGYGFQWWLEDDGDFSANGLGGQRIWVSPENGVVIVKSTLYTLAGGDETEAAFEAVAAEVARTRTAAPAR
ncbi:serine hydrolase domain-containing protein [Actinomadura algeriensis]|uniref:CubicO group peptidase (Beta-lactamase class C family) n=1 Tax=Actinomadura algeriensis TaxID=1679523 RepID=A0ABR9JZK9_9ACTN|nr:serine hydrolase domain-containing protein [Actinomadura algeriensis]MBE1536015.1 CubicO group peptidase (beta-lactamase class C family) [Actinomadura algeriensis]